MGRIKNTSSNYLIGLIIVSFLVRIFGFFREIILAKYFGTTLISDSYKIIVSVPSILLVFIGTGIATSFIPLYLEIEKHEGINEADNFLSNALNIFLFFGFVFCVCVHIFPSILIDLFAYGFRQDERHIMAVNLLRISIFSSLISIVLFFVQPFLQMKKKFFPIVLNTIPMNISLLLSYPIAAKFGYKYLAFGIIISSFSQLIFLLPTLHKTNFSYKLIFSMKDSHFINLVKMSIPITIGVATQQINAIIDRNMASSFNTGGVSSLDYANKLITFLVSIIASSIISVFYTSISKSFVNNDRKAMNIVITKAFIIVLIILIPASLGLLTFSNQIIRFIYERGSFTPKDTIISGEALFYYSIGVIPIGLRELLTRIFNSMKDNKTPTINSTLAVLLNIILNILLSKLIGLNGLPLATSISLSIGTLLLLISLIRNNKDLLDYNVILKNTFKIIICSFIMILCAFLIYNTLIKIISFEISLLFTVFFSSVLFLILIILANVDFLRDALSPFLNKLDRK